MNVTNEKIKYRQQRISDCHLENSAEHEDKNGVYEAQRITENTAIITDTERLIEEILGHQNLIKACKRVIKNKGSQGIDGMKYNELLPYFMKHEEEIRNSVFMGKYKPKPTKRVEIPKENGKTRKLGIPTVMDRVIQQAMVQVLSPIFELQFSENSFGFRPGKNQHQALKKAKEYIE